MARILIGADFIPSECNQKAFDNGDAKALVGEGLLNIINHADYRIFNLETAIYDGYSPIVKAGPNISAPTTSINGYKALKTDLLSIANNHVFDHGKEGFISTLNALDSAKIGRVGGGMNLEEAKAPFIFNLDGKKIGVYACCEHEFSWVEDFGCGSNGFDPFESLDEIVELKSKCDYVIVLYHGGKEHYVYPSPYLRKVCRKIIDKGADIVLCQHTHCVGTEEDYNGAKIVYGQGNFIFNKQYVKVETWLTGILVAIDIDNDGAKVSYYPYESTKTGIKLSSNPEIIGGFNRRSKEIMQKGFIEKKFSQLADEKYRWYLDVLAQASNPEKAGATVCNFVECEVHREMIITSLKNATARGETGTLG